MVKSDASSYREKIMPAYIVRFVLRAENLGTEEHPWYGKGYVYACDSGMLSN